MIALSKMKKSEVRRYYKRLRADMSLGEQDYLSNTIFTKSINTDIWRHRSYHIFLTAPGKMEVDTGYFLRYLDESDKEMICPKIDGKNTMKSFLVDTETDVKINSIGIPEPVNAIAFPDEEIDVIFMPLLGFDVRGNRVGYGKGFYDRFLTKCKSEVLKVGLSFFPPVFEIEDITEYDIPLDCCITPKEIFLF